MIAGLALAVASFASSCFPPPVQAPISVPYDRPACSFCPGHRGVEYELAQNTPVRAVSAGVVTFSGVVAGTRYLVVLESDGLRATYGLLAAALAGNGDRVTTGEVVGLSSARLYFGLRDASGTPVDPTALLGRFVGRPRLIPSDGTRARAGPAPNLRCPAGVFRVVGCLTCGLRR
jgi:murein DD-endopeptidase MepM/ murein hydrolase activator NlpD